MNQNEKALAACPFEHVEKDIGHRPYVQQNSTDLPWVQCTCGAAGPIMATEAQAIDAWNKRATQSQPVAGQASAETLIKKFEGIGLDRHDAQLCARVIQPLFAQQPQAPAVEAVSFENILEALKSFGEKWYEENDVADYTLDQFQEAQARAIYALLTTRQGAR